MAQAAIWNFATAFATPAERSLLQRGDVALRFELEETSAATFDIHTSMIDLRPSSESC